MSINPSFSSSSFNFRPPQPANDATINDGPTTGNVLDGQGSDFLDPDNILDTSTGFSNSIRPVTSNTLHQAFFGGHPFGMNPNQLDILNGTRNGINGALGFSLAYNPSNINALAWENPNPTDIILGSLNVQDKIFNGSPLFVPQPGLPPFQIPTGGSPVFGNNGSLFGNNSQINSGFGNSGSIFGNGGFGGGFPNIGGGFGGLYGVQNQNPAQQMQTYAQAIPVAFPVAIPVAVPVPVAIQQNFNPALFAQMNSGQSGYSNAYGQTGGNNPENALISMMSRMAGMMRLLFEQMAGAQGTGSSGSANAGSSASLY